MPQPKGTHICCRLLSLQSSVQGYVFKWILFEFNETPAEQCSVSIHIHRAKPLYHRNCHCLFILKRVRESLCGDHWLSSLHSFQPASRFWWHLYFEAKKSLIFGQYCNVSQLFSLERIYNSLCGDHRPSPLHVLQHVKHLAFGGIFALGLPQLYILISQGKNDISQKSSKLFFRKRIYDVGSIGLPLCLFSNTSSILLLVAFLPSADLHSFIK